MIEWSFELNAEAECSNGDVSLTMEIPEPPFQFYVGMYVWYPFNKADEETTETNDSKVKSIIVDITAMKFVIGIGNLPVLGKETVEDLCVRYRSCGWTCEPDD